MSSASICSAKYFFTSITGCNSNDVFNQVVKLVRNSPMNEPYSLKYKDSAVGGRFSIAQLTANKSKRPVKGFYNIEPTLTSKFSTKKVKTKDFYPQSFISSIISILGNKIHTKLYIRKLNAQNVQARAQ